MAIYWHPLLAQFLREDYGGRLDVRDSVKLGEMPLELDILLSPRVPVISLPYPFNYLGQTTIAELKGPSDTATWEDLAQLEGYACLYQRRDKKVRDRSQITLWLIASKYSSTFNQPPENYIDNLTKIGDGVSGGEIARFPIYLIDLGLLPITLHTIPLLIVYKGDPEREREIAAFFVKHYQQLRKYTYFFWRLHYKPLREVLGEMDLSDLRELDLDWPAIADLFEFLVEKQIIGVDKLVEKVGTEKVIQAIGVDKLVEKAGTEKVIQTIGREKFFATLFPNLTKEQMQEFIEQYGDGRKESNSE